MGQAAKAILCIGGSDSSAGAGIQADVKTGAVFGVYVATAITAVTAQNCSGVQVCAPLGADLLRQQIESVLQGFAIGAVKLGLMATAELLQEALEATDQLARVRVLDPVLGATAGGPLASRDLATALRDNLHRVALITPNLQEAAKLLDTDVARSFAEMRAQAYALQDLGANAVLIKGGHLEGPDAADLLVADAVEYPLSCARIDSTHTHGGGCSFATAVTAGLAQGLALPAAAAAAKSFMRGAIAASPRLGLAEHNGPLHQFYEYW